MWIRVEKHGESSANRIEAYAGAAKHPGFIGTAGKREDRHTHASTYATLIALNAACTRIGGQSEPVRS